METIESIKTVSVNKKGAYYFAVLLGISIINIPFWLLAIVALAFGGGSEKAFFIYTMPSALVAVGVIVSSIIGKKKGKRGWFLIPIIFSLCVLLPTIALEFNLPIIPNNFIEILLHIALRI